MEYLDLYDFKSNRIQRSGKVDQSDYEKKDDTKINSLLYKPIEAFIYQSEIEVILDS